VLIGKYFILSAIVHDENAVAAMSPAAREAFYRSEVVAVQTPYLVIGLVVLLFAVAAAVIRFPEHRAEETVGAPSRFVDVFRHPRLIFATVTQFFYVGAQVGIWSYTIRYAQANVPGMAEHDAADYLFASLVLFGIGRFAGTALMGRIAPPRLLAIFAVVSAVLAGIAGLAGGQIGLYALVLASLFMSIQFPTIFALGMDGLGPLRRAGASLIIMAIIGGAVLTGLMGHISDLAGIDTAMLVPAACFLVVLAFAVKADDPLSSVSRHWKTRRTSRCCHHPGEGRGPVGGRR